MDAAQRFAGCDLAESSVAIATHSDFPACYSAQLSGAARR